MKFGLIVRAYAPFPTFGLPSHEGDNRKATTAGLSSRIKAWVAFDPMSGAIEAPGGKSDKSTMLPSLFGGVSATGSPKVRVDHVQLGNGWMHFRMHAAGNVPTLDWVSPDIDMHAAITVSVGKGNLNLTGELTGDQFPNFEVMLQDESSTRRMVMTYETGHNRWTGPELNLWTDKKMPMNGICKSFPIDGSGRFV